MKFQIGPDQIFFLDSSKNELLTNRLGADNQIRPNIFNRQTLSGSEIKEIYFVHLRIEIVNQSDTVFLMRSNINSACKI